MTEDDIIQFVTSFPGIEVLTASEANNAPVVAWGDSFFYCDPDRDMPVNGRFPFATIVIKDYEGFDTASNLNRPGVFRLNIAVGRAAFQTLIGYPPDEHPGQPARFDDTALDQIIPHPIYATQAWASILNPGKATAAQARAPLSMPTLERPNATAHTYEQQAHVHYLRALSGSTVVGDGIP